MFSSLFKSWIGDSSKEEIKKFLFLGFIFFFTIGVYWFLRTSKDGVFNTIVGFDYQPMAKWVSMVFVIPLTMFYGYLVDKFPRHKVFYALSTIYGLSSLIFAYLLSNNSIGLANYESSPFRMLGWAYYLFVESFGSIMVVLFWSFVADTTNPESGKKWYPFLSFIAQIGALLGSMVNAGRFGKFPVTTTLFYCFFAIMFIPLIIYIFVTVTPKDQLKSYDENKEKLDSSSQKKSKPGILEGFRLVFSNMYLLGIFFSIMIYEIVTTLFDFRFKALISESVSEYVLLNNVPTSEIGALKTQMFGEWVGFMGEWSAILGMASFIFGMGKIARKLGLTYSLVILPVLLTIVAFLLGSSKSLMVAAIAVIVAKGINYALYQPSKEQLYIPTSKDAKYKSKVFIEAFGSRTSKAAGSLINAIKFYFPVIFPIISLGSSVILCTIWLGISIYLGKTYDKAVSKNEVVC